MHAMQYNFTSNVIALAMNVKFVRLSKYVDLHAVFHLEFVLHLANTIYFRK